MLGSAKSLRSETVKRLATISLLCLTVGLVMSLSALAEEIVLKDGTKIIGHMTGVTSDKIDVETSNGKIKLKRSDIMAINFSESSSGKAPGTGADKQDLRTPKNDETLNGTQYVNRTNNFSLTLPPGWIIDKNLLGLPSALAGLTSKDKTRLAVVTQEEYPGSLESYKELTVLQMQRILEDFENLSESNTVIDGKPAVLVFYRGVVPKSNDLPLEFLTAIINSGNGFTKVTAWCVEPLFHDMQPAFENIVNSYHSLSRVTTADTPAKPQ